MYIFNQQLLIQIFLLPFVRGQMIVNQMCESSGCDDDGNRNMSRTETGRLFQFNSEESKIRVELAFGIPFISIPVPFGNKQSESEPINVDLGALAAGGVVSIAAYLFAPSLFTGLQPTASIGRNLKSEMSDLWNRMEQGLHNHDIDAAICTQRAICQAVYAAQSKMHLGHAGSLDKIVDGLVTNSWLQNWLAGTAISEAVTRGRNRGDCAKHYQECKVTQDSLRSTLMNLMNDNN